MTAPALPGVTWTRVFPATPDQVRAARRFLAGVVSDCPQAGDAITCLSELAANSVCHSRSAWPGGRFLVRVTRAAGWLRVEVTDEGGPWAPRPAGGGYGRGLAIVAALASYVHVSDPDGDPPRRTVSFWLRLI